MNSTEIRERLGLTRSQWAHALGVNTRTVSRWEDEGTVPYGVAFEVMRGISLALEMGSDPIEVGRALETAGIGWLLCHGVTTKLGAAASMAAPTSTNGHSKRGRTR